MSRRGTTAAQQFYGRWAQLYDLLAVATPGLSELRSRVADELHLSPGDTVIEMGCGTGANFPHLRERVGPAGRVVGVDFTRGMLEQARDRIDREGWENVHVVQADAATSSPREDVDAVLATFVIGMLGDPHGTVTRWLDGIRPDGHLALLDAGRSSRTYSWPVNLAFKGLVLASTPGDISAFEKPPWYVLDERIEESRRALSAGAVDVQDSEHALGVVRITGGRVAESR
ncbi:alkanonic acid methyltransferase [Haladaptatus sp. R4]|uniref:class I SAM-dependent methyltransferase n=1 Tax=Haladaptatus sp. R4 TaxID=1679489 RepID=UPI0007B49CB0|nr:class I SAM-dependent methyltransferase [Haladaptatus sp. R4]KZN24642.1 alkanonic acid methyltransferase [Haladaptatus sp. R4]